MIICVLLFDIIPKQGQLEQQQQGYNIFDCNKTAIIFKWKKHVYCQSVA